MRVNAYMNFLKTNVTSWTQEKRQQENTDQSEIALPHPHGKDRVTLSSNADLKETVYENFGKKVGDTDCNPAADLNKDGVVNVKDKLIVRQMDQMEKTREEFGESPGTGNSAADLNNDGVVNILDKLMARNRLSKMMNL